jgi:hypothetical protein
MSGLLSSPLTARPATRRSHSVGRAERQEFRQHLVTRYDRLPLQRGGKFHDGAMGAVARVGERYPVERVREKCAHPFLLGAP